MRYKKSNISPGIHRRHISAAEDINYARNNLKNPEKFLAVKFDGNRVVQLDPSEKVDRAKSQVRKMLDKLRYKAKGE